MSDVSFGGTCACCGGEHAWLDPVFRRPDAFVRLAPGKRRLYTVANDDLCRLMLPKQAERHFVRGTLPVVIAGRSEDLRWGLWAEVSATAFHRVIELWESPDQAREPAFPGNLANAIPGYPNSVGLPLIIRLTGPTTRPDFGFSPGAQHPFAAECLAGIDCARAAAWLAAAFGDR